MGTAAVFLALSATAAAADPRLDEIVYSPYIENHVFELENRWGQELGGGSLNNARTFVTEAEYGVNDRLSLALITQVERVPGTPEKLVGVGVESVFYIGQIPRLGVDVGGYLEYKVGAGGESDVGEAKLLLAKNVDRFQGLFNFIIEHPIGAPRGEDISTYGYAASATWRTVGPLRLGVEALGDLGDDHGFLTRAEGAYVGPQVKWEGKVDFLPFEVAVDAGWLAAVGPTRNEAASQARINLELEHRF